MTRRVAMGCAIAAMAVGVTALAAAPTTPRTAGTEPATQAASPLYTELLGDYMTGQWDALTEALKTKTAELGRLLPAEQEDVAAMRLGMREGRPEWWAVTKSGKKGQIMALVWGRRIPVQFDPTTSNGYDTKTKKGKLELLAGWQNSDMDSTAQAGGAPQGFTRGDVVCMTAFSNLGKVDAASLIPAGGTELQKERYLEMRGILTAMAFGTPPARRYALWVSLASFTEANPKPAVRMGRRAAGAMFMMDVLDHPEMFPSIVLPKEAPANKAEEVVGLALADFVAAHPLDFTEDNTLKMAAKKMAAVNGNNAFKTETVTLPNKLTMALDPNKDAGLLAARNAWIVKALAKRAAAAGN